MAKILHCSDAGFDCSAVVRGASNEEILTQVRRHAREDHGLEVTPELEQQLVTVIANE